MKLFEITNKVPSIQNRIYDLVIKYLTSENFIAKLYDGDDDEADKILKRNAPITADIRTGLRSMSRSTDRFWTEMFDDVHEEIRKLKDGYNTHHLDDLLNAIHSALEDVANNMIDWMGDRMNHEPGYKPVRLSFDPYSIPDEEIIAMLEQDPEVKQAIEESDNDFKEKEAEELRMKQERASKVKDELVQKIGKFIDANWHLNVTNIFRKVAKDPERYDFKSAPASEKEMLDELYRLNPATLIDWVTSNLSYSRNKSMYDVSNLVFHSPELAKRIIAASEKLASLGFK